MDALTLPSDLALEAPPLTPLVIEANFLSLVIMAAAKTDRSEPEWPIQPSRMFSALVEALHQIHVHDPTRAQAEAAVLWLETLEPPEVHAPAEDGSVRPLSYVPFNDAVYDDRIKSKRVETCLPDSPRRKKARVSPGVSVPVPVIRYVWQVDLGQMAEHRAALQLLLSRVASLGRAVNFVIMRLLEVPPEVLPHFDVLERWVPSPRGSRRMRVFGPGRLAQLRRLYEEGKPVDYGPASFYLRVGEEPPPEAAAGPWSTLWTVFTLAGCRLTAADTEGVAKAIRRALVIRAVEPGMFAGNGASVDPFISGHEPDGSPAHIERLAVVPLANVMNAYADGRIMGFAVAMPACATVGQWQAMSALFFGHDKAPPLDHVRVGRDEIRVGQVSRRVQALSPERYVATSAVWATVTPILLSRRPDKGRAPTPFDVRDERARLQVMRDCVASGLPAPIRVEVGPASPLEGVGHARAFRQDRGGPTRWAVHATLFFDRPVQGPLLVGAGRYNGLGLLVPMPASDRKE